MTRNPCPTCGDPMLGAHYHEPECPACGAWLEDLIGEGDDGATYCAACGEPEPIAGYVRKCHRAKGNAPPEAVGR